MHDRRTFLKSMTAAAVGMGLAGVVPSAMSQVPRREVSIGGQRVTVVDVHGHCAVIEVEDVIRGTDVERRNVPEPDSGPAPDRRAQ